MSCLHGNNGKTSMMRVGFAVSLVVGSALAMAGCAGMFMSVSDAGTAMTLGAGLIGSSAFAKAVQAKYEGAAYEPNGR